MNEDGNMMQSDPKNTELKNPNNGWRHRLHEIIFEAETFYGKLFDVVLLVCIVFSVLVIVLESVKDYQSQYGDLYNQLEWVFTILFTIEYFLRIVTVQKPSKYIFSFFGLVDLFAIVPAYLALLWADAESFAVIRSLRLLRVFRVLKLAQFVGESKLLMTAMRQSMRKITVFLGAVLTLALIIGAAMYTIEGEQNGFTSIPQSIYWTIVTLTTVGYGDIAPGTTLGKFLASVVMIMGYGILAVPTGIVTVELAGLGKRPVSTHACEACSKEGHDVDAVHCKYCGGKL